jgi:hypothetical protein
MNVYAVTAVVMLQSGSDDGLSIGELVRNLPTDPASFFTLALLVGSFVLVVWAGRSGGGGRGSG